MVPPVFLCLWEGRVKAELPRISAAGRGGAPCALYAVCDYVFGTAPGRVSGTMVSGVGNNLLKWETVEDWNVGVDMSFLDSRLDMTFEYFQKKSSDMLYQKQNIFAIGYPDWNSTVWTAEAAAAIPRFSYRPDWKAYSLRR